MFWVRIFIVLVFPVVVWSGITIPVGFSATFVQKVTNAKKKTIRYTGALFVNRSREFHWTYRTPMLREICGDGSRVRVIDHALKQVVVYKVGSLLDLMQLLKRAERYRPDIYLAKYHGVRYTLKIDHQGRIEQIAYTDAMDNVVNIHFHHVLYRAVPVTPSQLRCTVPASYDIVKGSS